MSDISPRTRIINTWETLNHAISDYERGRATYQEVRDAHREYRLACHTAGEPYFILEDIANDDMAHIPRDYPAVRPALPAHAGAYDTPTLQSRREQIRSLVNDPKAVQRILDATAERGELNRLYHQVMEAARKNPQWREKLLADLMKGTVQ